MFGAACTHRSVHRLTTCACCHVALTASLFPYSLLFAHAVMSAVSGLKEATDAVTQQTVVGVSIAVLVLLFSVQRCGTSKVGQ